MNRDEQEFGMVSRARRLRREMSDAESKLWSELRGRRFVGCKFRRQRPVGAYIVDFVCYEPKLVIEIDGGQHGRREQSEDDRERTRWLSANGFKVIRFWNDEVLQNLDGVLEVILKEIDSLRQQGPPHRPGPSP